MMMITLQWRTYTVSKKKVSQNVCYIVYKPGLILIKFGTECLK